MNWHVTIWKRLWLWLAATTLLHETLPQPLAQTNEPPVTEWSLTSPPNRAFEDPFDQGEDIGPVHDPLEKVNRAMFQFNDRLYFWVLKPVASGYSRVVPEPTRVSIRHFFTNLKAPVRIVHSVAQGKFSGAQREAGRFVINSTVGIGGLFDPAAFWQIAPQEEDLDQTLAFYGVAPGPYLHWPVFGPSSVRGTFGRIGDGFLNPLHYAGIPIFGHVGIHTHETVNAGSLTLGNYEQLKESALDPYLSLRDSYFQSRLNLLGQ